MALSIKKQGINFEIDQGCTFSKTFTAKNANNANVTITAGSIAARMQKSHDTSNTSLRLKDDITPPSSIFIDPS